MLPAEQNNYEEKVILIGCITFSLCCSFLNEFFSKLADDVDEVAKSFLQDHRGNVHERVLIPEMILAHVVHCHVLAWYLLYARVDVHHWVHHSECVCKWILFARVICGGKYVVWRDRLKNRTFLVNTKITNRKRKEKNESWLLIINLQLNWKLLIRYDDHFLCNRAEKTDATGLWKCRQFSQENNFSISPWSPVFTQNKLLKRWFCSQTIKMGPKHESAEHLRVRAEIVSSYKKHNKQHLL